MTVGGLCLVVGACNVDTGTSPVVPSEPDTVVSSIEMLPPERTIGVLGTQVGVRALALNKDGQTLYGSYLDPGRFSWSSSEPDVAPVASGLVTGLAEGDATIRATSQGVTGAMPVTVRDRAHVAWSLSLGMGSTRGGVSIGHDGTIYVGTDDSAADGSRWFALSPQGGILWTLDLPLTSLQTPAIAEDGTLYLGSMSSSGLIGRLIAVHPAGTVRWMLEDFEEAIRSSPALGPDGTVYVAVGRHLYAVDPDGEIRWKHETTTGRAFVFSSPAVASDGTIYVGGEDQFLHAINPDGSGRWTFRARDRIRSSPSIGADGTIYFGSYDGWLYAVHPDGTERWSVGLHCGLPWGCQPVSSSPSIGPDGTIYIGAGNLYAVDPGGSIAWDFRPGCEVMRAPLLAANGNVHVGMITLEAQGHRVWDYGTGTRIHGCGSSAIGVDGTIISASFTDMPSTPQEVMVHAIRENGSSNGGFDGSPWPTERGNRANNGRAGGG